MLSAKERENEKRSKKDLMNIYHIPDIPRGAFNDMTNWQTCASLAEIDRSQLSSLSDKAIEKQAFLFSRNEAARVSKLFRKQGEVQSDMQCTRRDEGDKKKESWNERKKTETDRDEDRER